MAKVYRLSDRIKYKIGEVEIQISPLSVHDKSVLHGYMHRAQNGSIEALMEGSAQAIKFGVKSISGVEDSSGKPYELKFEEGKTCLTDDCVNDLMNLTQSPQMITLCSQLIAGVPSQLPEGVSLVEDDSRPNVSKSKKASKSSGSTSSEK
jgi:hypothetical protein